MSTINIGEGMRFGMGVDSSSGLVRGEAIVFDREDKEDGGQIVDADVTMIQSQESLLESLNISVSGSFQLAFEASGDMKTQLAQENAINNSSVYMLFKAVVKNPPSFMVNPRLADSAKAIYQSDPEQFRQLFGDVYIDSIISGGEFFGLFIFKTEDESSKTDVSAQLNLSIGNFLEGGEISASFHDTIQRVNTRSQMEIKAFMSGGAGLQNPQNLDDLATLYKTFNKAALDNPVKYQVTLKDFRFLPLPLGPSFVEQFVRQNNMKECGQRVIEAIQQRAEIQYILDNESEFVSPDAAVLGDALQKIDALIPRLGQRATECANAPTADVDRACSLADLESVVVNLPARQAVTDPLGLKLADIRAHDSRAAAAFPDAFQPKNFDNGPKNGRFMIFRDPANQNNTTGGVFWRADIDNGNAHVVYGAIFQEYLRRGHCEGLLGYPLDDENSDDVTAPDRTQLFEGPGSHVSVFFNGTTGQVKVLGLDEPPSGGTNAPQPPFHNPIHLPFKENF